MYTQSTISVPACKMSPTHSPTVCMSPSGHRHPEHSHGDLVVVGDSCSPAAALTVGRSLNRWRQRCCWGCSRGDHEEGSRGRQQIAQRASRGMQAEGRHAAQVCSCCGGGSLGYPGQRVYVEIALSRQLTPLIRRTQRFEAHIWDDRRQVYLGGYDVSTSGGGPSL